MGNKPVFLFAMVLVLGNGIYSKSLTRKYKYHIGMDRNGELVLEWNVNYIQNIIQFRLLANLHHGMKWFGIGFSDYGDLNRADFAVYWVDEQMLHRFQDCWTDNEKRLHVDRQQDYVLKSSHSDRIRIVLEFTRKFETCDTKDYQFDNGTTHIVYFVDNRSPSSIEGINVTSLKTGLQRVQLLKPDLPSHVFPEDTWTFEVRAPSVHVPATDTTYWWFTTRLPAMPRKHHIIQYEGIIQHGSENLVHHMEVFHCEVGPHDKVRYYNGPGVSEGKPPELSACRNVIGAWAMGAGPFTLPEEAGTPVGGKELSPFVLLEVHYNNPHRKKDLIDTSGIRFYVTSHLRPYDSGIMELGLEYTDKMAIPPHQKRFSLTGYCTHQCTSIGLPFSGMYVFGSQLHTHLTGERAFTKHVRHGTELPELNRDNHYSPHFQEIRRLPVPVHVLPGDDLITTCEYGTLDRDNVTVGGLSIKNEMCVNYVHYYPRTRLEVCKSSISDTALSKYFVFMNMYDGDKTSLKKGVEENYQSVRWTASNARLLHTVYNIAPISMQCNQSDGTRFPGHWEGVSKTTISFPRRRPDSTCQPKSTKFKAWVFI